MPGAARKDIDSAGGLIREGSNNVFVNGSPAVRIGNSVNSHGRRWRRRHKGVVIAEGSSTVFVNGLNMSREGDKASCGHSISSGSNNVSVG